MVFETAPPRDKAPRVSMNVAHIHTWSNVKAPDPTIMEFSKNNLKKKKLMIYKL